MNTKPTAIQQTILDYIAEHWAQHGYSPSQREIQRYFGYRSQTAIVDHLRALQRKGYIKTTPGVTRSIVILNPAAK